MHARRQAQADTTLLHIATDREHERTMLQRAVHGSERKEAPRPSLTQQPVLEARPLRSSRDRSRSSAHSPAAESWKLAQVDLFAGLGNGRIEVAPLRDVLRNPCPRLVSRGDHRERERERELLFKRVPEHLCLRQLIHGHTTRHARVAASAPRFKWTVWQQ